MKVYFWVHNGIYRALTEEGYLLLQTKEKRVARDFESSRIYINGVEATRIRVRKPENNQYLLAALLMSYTKNPHDVYGWYSNLPSNFKRTLNGRRSRIARIISGWR